MQVDDDVDISIGSAVGGAIRLPPGLVEAKHITLRHRINKWSYHAHGEVDIISRGRQKTVHSGDVGLIELPCELTIGPWRIATSSGESTDADIASPMRTASLARELARSLMSGNTAPALALLNSNGVETDKRELPPPEIRITIGRGEDADWHIDDDDLSRLHLAVVRGWDGVHVIDLASKNGSQLNGDPIATDVGTQIHDGDIITMGSHRLRFSDPAEALEIVSEPPVAPLTAPAPPLHPSVDQRSRDSITFYLAIAICAIATLAAIWLLFAGLRATPVTLP
jgi:hypothetical protein